MGLGGLGYHLVGTRFIAGTACTRLNEISECSACIPLIQHFIGDH